MSLRKKTRDLENILINFKVKVDDIKKEVPDFHGPGRGSRTPIEIELNRLTEIAQAALNALENLKKI